LKKKQPREQVRNVRISTLHPDIPTTGGTAIILRQVRSSQRLMADFQ
jgi:hypothetical protein